MTWGATKGPPRTSGARRARGTWRAGAAGIGVALILAGCATRLAPDGVYRSSKGYRVTLPGPDWRVVRESHADLELRHGQAPAGMVVNASCEASLADRPVDTLRREILAGFSGRRVQVHDAVRVSGREAAHMIVDGQDGRPPGPVRVELIVLKGDRCVYDLLYAAPPADFARWQGAFERLVGTFALE